MDRIDAPMLVWPWLWHLRDTWNLYETCLGIRPESDGFLGRLFTQIYPKELSVAVHSKTDGHSQRASPPPKEGIVMIPERLGGMDMRLAELIADHVVRLEQIQQVVIFRDGLQYFHILSSPSLIERYGIAVIEGSADQPLSDLIGQALRKKFLRQIPATSSLHNQQFRRGGKPKPKRL